MQELLSGQEVLGFSIEGDNIVRYFQQKQNPIVSITDKYTTCKENASPVSRLPALPHQYTAAKNRRSSILWQESTQ